jgi:hypothetical protein
MPDKVELLGMVIVDVPAVPVQPPCKPRIFTQSQVLAAREHAMHGGQAIHLHRMLGLNPPQCFARDVRAGKDIAHVFDQNTARLIATAKKMGVRVILVDRLNSAHQHIDMCGKPLEKLLQLAGYEPEDRSS